AGSSCSTASPPSQIPTASRCTNIVEVATSWVSSPAAWPVIALAKPTIAIATATMRATVTEDPVTAMVVAVAETTNASTSQIPRSVPRKTFRSDPKRSEPTACPVATAYENAREAPRASVVTAAAIATRVIARVRSPGSRSSQPARTDPPRATATARSAINAETGAPRRAIRPASRSTTLLPPAASAASTAIRARTATVTAAAPSSSGEGRAGGACRGAAGPAARPAVRVLWSGALMCRSPVRSTAWPCPPRCSAAGSRWRPRSLPPAPVRCCPSLRWTSSTVPRTLRPRAAGRSAPRTRWPSRSWPRRSPAGSRRPYWRGRSARARSAPRRHGSGGGRPTAGRTRRSPSAPAIRSRPAAPPASACRRSSGLLALLGIGSVVGAVRGLEILGTLDVLVTLRGLVTLGDAVDAVAPGGFDGLGGVDGAVGAAGRSAAAGRLGAGRPRPFRATASRVLAPTRRVLASAGQAAAQHESGQHRAQAQHDGGHRVAEGRDRELRADHGRALQDHGGHGGEASAQSRAQQRPHPGPAGTDLQRPDQGAQ